MVALEYLSTTLVPVLDVTSLVDDVVHVGRLLFPVARKTLNDGTRILLRTVVFPEKPKKLIYYEDMT